MQDQNYEKEALKAWVFRFCSPITGIAVLAVGMNRDVVRVQIVTEALDPECPEIMRSLTGKVMVMERELGCAYPRHKIFVEVVIPAEGSSPEEILALPREKLASMWVTPGNQIN